MIDLTKDTIDDFGDSVKDNGQVAVGEFIDSLLYDSVLPSEMYKRIGITKVIDGSVYEFSVVAKLIEN